MKKHLKFLVASAIFLANVGLLAYFIGFFLTPIKQTARYDCYLQLDKNIICYFKEE